MSSDTKLAQLIGHHSDIETIAKITGHSAGRSHTIDQFCALEGISRSFFYKLKAQGKAPRIFNVGNCPRISEEARTAWRRQLEAEAGGAE
jgi:predicted DNA-binding transcriptional regulator AlpA